VLEHAVEPRVHLPEELDRPASRRRGHWPLVLQPAVSQEEGLMIATGDFKRGARILVDGEPYTIDDYTVQSPSARGAATLVKVRLRHVVTGQVSDRTFKAGERFDEPDVAIRTVQFLYRDGDDFHFMDQQSYDQFVLRADALGETAPWLTENMELTAVLYNGHAVGVTLPSFIEAEVDMVGGGSRGDTASGKNLKDATLTNGRTLKVPLFIESGERVLVDTRTWEFSRRAPRA
jgi:elongation factor P